MVLDDTSSPAGIEYHGTAGASRECLAAVMNLIQTRAAIKRARIITAPGAQSNRRHALLLTTEVGDQIAVKSGFASGYGGTGPHCLSLALTFLDIHGTEIINEWDAPADLIDRLDQSALTRADLATIEEGRTVQPSRWSDYIYEDHFKQSLDGRLWRQFEPVIPFSIIDPRLMDLARSFWIDPDAALNRGYRRLEDTIRARIGSHASNTGLFAEAFTRSPPKLSWEVADESEKQGRANLFGAVFMAYRNPRAHREVPSADSLAELLLLNQLYRLESEAVNIQPAATA